jgi:hypothetical protein
MYSLHTFTILGPKYFETCGFIFTCTLFLNVPFLLDQLAGLQRLETLAPPQENQYEFQD